MQRVCLFGLALRAQVCGQQTEEKGMSVRPVPVPLAADTTLLLLLPVFVLLAAAPHHSGCPVDNWRRSGGCCCVLLSSTRMRPMTCRVCFISFCFVVCMTDCLAGLHLSDSTALHAFALLCAHMHQNRRCKKRPAPSTCAVADAAAAALLRRPSPAK